MQAAKAAFDIEGGGDGRGRGGGWRKQEGKKEGGGGGGGGGWWVAEANLIESHEALLSCNDPDSVEEAIIVSHGQPSA